jgi:hypothetical protein
MRRHEREEQRNRLVAMEQLIANSTSTAKPGSHWPARYNEL